MDLIMQPSYAMPLLGVAAVYALLRALVYVTQESREPPVVPFTVPFIGPLVGMFREGTQFYTTIRDKYHWPVWTLRLPGARIYVVNSTALIPAAQRQFRTLAFTPILARVAESIMGVSEEGLAIMKEDVIADHGYLMSFSAAMHPGVAPGAGLDAMNAAAVKVLATSLAKLNRSSPTRVNLYQWARHEVFMATSDAVYGPKNPIRDPAVEAAWNKFEPAILIFVLNLFPNLIARESLRARDFVIQSLAQYFRDGGHLEGSELVRRRYEHNKEFNITNSDIARVETGNVFAIISNTGPATFWLIYHIYSDPVVLDDCRREVVSLCTEESDAGRTTTTLDITNVKQSCPKLLSTVQEVLRYYGVSMSTRVVLEDHLFDGQYLLKKGSTLMIPSSVQHTARDAWGDNVGRFDHERFVKKSGKKTPNPVAFRAFGGGHTLCPGRHFATTELLAFVAMMLLRFDVRPVVGAWERPMTGRAASTAGVMPPDDEVEVGLVPREIADLRVVLGGSDKAMMISAEDINGGSFFD